MQCKYVVKEKKRAKYIVDNIEIYSDSDEESSDEENSHEKKFGWTKFWWRKLKNTHTKKKTKYFFIIFFSIYKNGKWILKTQRKTKKRSM